MATPSLLTLFCDIFEVCLFIKDLFTFVAESVRFRNRVESTGLAQCIVMEVAKF